MFHNSRSSLNKSIYLQIIEGWFSTVYRVENYNQSKTSIRLKKTLQNSSGEKNALALNALSDSFDEILILNYTKFFFNYKQTLTLGIGSTVDVNWSN